MRVVVVYATVEGQTRKIADAIAARLRELGHAAEAVDATGASGTVLEGADAAILCGPIHAGRYPSALVHFARDNAERLNAMPTAMVSVSLGIVGDAVERRDVESYPGKLFDETGWTARTVHHAAGALRFAEYDFFKRWFMRQVARRHGHRGAEDREFTDWAALDSFVDTFLEGIEGG